MDNERDRRISILGDTLRAAYVLPGAGQIRYWQNTCNGQPESKFWLPRHLFNESGTTNYESVRPVLATISFARCLPWIRV